MIGGGGTSVFALTLKSRVRWAFDAPAPARATSEAITRSKTRRDARRASATDIATCARPGARAEVTIFRPDRAGLENFARTARDRARDDRELARA